MDIAVIISILVLLVCLALLIYLVYYSNKKNSLKVYYWLILADIVYLVAYFYEAGGRNIAGNLYVYWDILSLFIIVSFASFGLSMLLVDQEKRFQGMAFISVRLMVIDTILTYGFVAFANPDRIASEGNTLVSVLIHHPLTYFLVKLLPACILMLYIYFNRAYKKPLFYYLFTAIYLIYFLALVINSQLGYDPFKKYITLLYIFLYNIFVVLIYATVINVKQRKLETAINNK